MTNELTSLVFQTEVAAEVVDEWKMGYRGKVNYNNSDSRAALMTIESHS